VVPCFRINYSGESKLNVLFLVRHGDTAWHDEGRIIGRQDVSLNLAGRKQIESLRRVLALLKPDSLYTSPIKRAVESAEILAGRLRLAPIELPGVTELNTGEWTGRTVDELFATDEAWRAFRTDATSVRVPGGEDVYEVRDRIVESVEQIMAAGHQRSVVVTHSAVIRIAACHYIGLPLQHLRAVRADTGSLTVLRLFDGRRGQLAALNYRSPIGRM
jgi:probable phosphoglycerate mutase